MERPEPADARFGKEFWDMSSSITVLLGDSDPTALLVMTRALQSIPGVELAGGVRSREMLLAKIRHTDVDMVILDLEAEGMGGIATMDRIRQLSPYLPVIIVFNPGASDPETAVTALEMGAGDCLEKPRDTDSAGFKEFRLRLLTLLGLARSRKAFGLRHRPLTRKPGRSPGTTGTPPSTRPPLSSADIAPPGVRPGRVQVVVIASSTGGPAALLDILPKLPPDLGVPVLLVQHMPAHMTASFARSLDSRCAVTVSEAGDGDEILPSRVYVAPGGRHMTVSRKDSRNRRFIRLSDTPPENSVRPSADVLFRSVADSFDATILAVVLTGMGEDGKRGVMAMKERGCICFTQAAESCIVYGMPRAIDMAGLSDGSYDVDLIPLKVAMALRQGGDRS
jgi:two-component system chemotaxis response regulator CheB